MVNRIKGWGYKGKSKYGKGLGYKKRVKMIKVGVIK